MKKKIVLVLLLLSSILQADISGVVFRELPFNGTVLNTYAVQDSNELGIAGVTVTAYDTNGMVSSATTDATGHYTLATSAGKYRVEFSNWANYLSESTYGNVNNTSVRFTDDGTTINLGLYNPTDYVGKNPKILAVTLAAGKLSKQGDLASLRSFTYNPTQAIYDEDDLDEETSTLAVMEETGFIWGLAYDRKHKNAYTTTTVRRHIDKAPDGIGAIYVTDLSDPENPSTTLFTKVDSGTVPDADARNFTRNAYSHDPVMEQVANVGLGDIDISEDGKKLYTINLKTQELVEIDIATKVQTSHPISNPFGGNCPDTDVRSWAVAPHDGAVYVGSVCSTNVTVGSAVSKWDGSSFSTIITTPLNYARQDREEGNDQSDDWGKWESNPSLLFVQEDNKGVIIGNPQPILSDIEFTEDGGMVLGLSDRFAFMTGYNNWAPDENDKTRYTGEAVGDTLRICYENGNYVNEGQGSCSQHTDSLGTPSGSNEYFLGDTYNSDAITRVHNETTLGALLYISGSKNITTTAYDMVDLQGYRGVDRSGVMYMDMTTGEHLGGLVLNGAGTEAGSKYGLAKAGGMGDIELLTDPAPIEIGNRVWFDDDEDGIQDAEEKGYANVPVQLECKENGTYVAYGTATTDSKGYYYFGGEKNTNLKSGKKISSDIECKLKITKADIDNKEITIANVDSNGKDNIDNDALELGADYVIDLNISYKNDHSFDFGIKLPKGCLTGTLFEDLDNNGVVDSSDNRAPQGISVKIVDSLGKEYSKVTDANGKFSLDALPVGPVKVTVDTTDTDIPDGTKWTFSVKDINVSQGVAPNCSETIFPYTIPTEKARDPKDSAVCANPSSLTWEGATVGSASVWSTPTVDTVKTFTTVGGASVAVSMKITNNTNSEYNKDSSGTSAAFGEPYLTLYLGDQTTHGDGDWSNSDGSGCQDHGYDLTSGESYDLVVDFNESVVLDNWRIRDIDSGDVRSGESDWEWQDAISVKAYNASGDEVAIETKLGDSGAGLIKDSNGLVHTDKNSYDAGAGAGDFVTGEGTTPNSTNGHIVLTSNFKSITKLVITHSAGPDIACQTRSALAMSGLAVCKPLQISGQVFDDADGYSNPQDTACNTKGTTIDGTPIASVEGEELHICLIDTNNYKVMATTNVQSNGRYLFDEDIKPNSNLRLLLTTNSCVVGSDAPAAKLPDNWNFEGDASDSVKDGVLDITVVSTSLIDLNFAINKNPESKSFTAPVKVNQGGTNFVTIGSDFMDFNDSEESDIEKIQITSISSNGVLQYNSTNVSVGDIIDSVNDSLFTIDPTKDSKVTATYTYVAMDKACRVSEKSMVTVPFSVPKISGTLYLDKTKNGVIEHTTPTSKSCDNTSPLYINLVDSTGAVLSSTELDGDGNYLFTYTDGVRVDSSYSLILSDKEDVNSSSIPLGCSIVEQEEKSTVSDGSADGKIEVSVVKTDVVDLDFSITPTVTLGDKVWVDNNKDGIQDSNESGIADINVTLYNTADCSGVEVSSMKTDANGLYEFPNLLVGTYCVKFTELPIGYSISPKDSGADSKDSDADTNGLIQNINLTANDPREDMGIYPPIIVIPTVCLGDFVWIDSNKNGLQDLGESSKNNVVVNLYEDGNSTIKSTTKTKNGGKYQFCGLAQNSKYIVEFIKPDGYEFTSKNRGDDTKDSDVSVTTGKTETVEVNTTNNLTIDAGIYRKETTPVSTPIPTPTPTPSSEPLDTNETISLHVTDDEIEANTEGSVTTIDILGNDENLDAKTIKLISPDDGENLWKEGTSGKDINVTEYDELKVDGEGTWRVTSDGKVTFTAEDGFTGTPTPIYYVVKSKQGKASNVGQIKIITDCVCNDYEKSVASMNLYAMLLMLLLTSSLALLFRKELNQ